MYCYICQSNKFHGTTGELQKHSESQMLSENKPQLFFPKMWFV